LGFLLRYVPKYGRLFCASILCLVVESVCDLLQPTIMARIVDVGVANRDFGVVVNLGGVMLLVTAVGALGAVGRNILSSTVSQNFGADLRQDLFTKVQLLSLDDLSRFEPASLITRLTNDVTQVQEFVHRLMRIFVRAPILAVGAAAMAIYLNPRLSTILAVVIPVVGLLVALNLQIGFPRFRRVQEAVDGINRSLREYLAGVRVVKAFNRSQYERERFAAANQEAAESAVRAERVMAFFSPSIIFTVNMGIVAVLWFGGIAVRAGSLEVGKVIAFVNYMVQMLHALMRIFIVFTRFVRARASAERINELFQQVDSNTAPDGGFSGEIRGEIQFRNVSFAYPGSTGEPVLKDISFHINPGETLGIIGATGSGKTTLVSLIPKLYHATAGKITIDGIDLREWNTGRLRERIGFVPQKSLLFSGTILDNIRWGNPQASLSEVRQAAETAQIDSFIVGLPAGYDSAVGQRGVNLSGGQKQRLAVARALVKKPAILVLDDCTSALDAITEARIRRALSEQMQGTTCIIISQRVTSMMGADRILVLDEGRVVGLGTHAELMQHCPVYQDIYHLQVGRKGAV
jgi:ATP-binding cassette subfamily B multidrug efflux pump